MTPLSGDGTSRSAFVKRTLLRRDPSPFVVDLTLAAVRIALAWIFLYYGGGKLFAWFHGPGLQRTAVFFASSAHLHPGMFFAVLGGIIEFVGATCVALGLATRLAGLALAGDQVMAMITVTWAHGINSLSNTPGYEFNMALCVLALVMVAFGAGRFSLDATWGRRRLAAPQATRATRAM